MKKIILLLGSIFLFQSQSNSQCVSSVHQNVVSIKNSGQQLNASNKKYWICDGGVLSLTGNNNSIWVDRNGVFSVSGDSNIIYARATSTVSIAGDGNSIEIDVKVNQAGNYTDNGSNTMKTNCTPMIFDYSVAPSDGCVFWTGSDEINKVQDVHLYPSPANDLLYIEFSEETFDVLKIEVYDMTGKMASSMRIENAAQRTEVDLSALKNGLYTLRIYNGNSVLNKSFIVQH